MKATADKPKRRGVATRLAAAAGGLLGRVLAASDERRAIALAEKPTGRLDHTWSARASSTQRAYEAATENRANADWRTGLTSSTLAIIEGLDVMLARSRWMIRNDGYAASAQGGYRRKVVGGGITARASARHPGEGGMLKTYNAALDLLWNAWATDPLTCDVEQTKCLYEKQALWMDELFAAGGLLLRWVYEPQTDRVGLRIQELEYEQLNRDLTHNEGRAVFNGIETDEYGAPLGYHVFGAAHPLEEVASKSMRLEAPECFHLFRKARVRQRIGAPMMAAVMPALRNLAMYELYTIGKARTEAAYHGFVEEPGNTGVTLDAIRKQVGGKTPAGEGDDDNMRVRVENGLFPVLRSGRKVTFPTPSTPNSVYEPFVTQNLKRIAAGTGLDLPTLARWYAEGNFNTQRKAGLEMEAETDAIQDLQFINGALRRCRELFIEIAVREGKLSATGFFESARWRAAYLTTNWQGPPRRSVDEIKDQAAWDMKYRSLRGTPQDYCNEQGTDIRDKLSEWQEFLELARDEYKLGPLLDRFFGTGTANAPKAGMRPDGSGDDGDDGGDGDGGLGALFTREKILQGLLDAGDNGHGKP